MGKRSFKYYAFISYSRADSAFANKLYSMLNGYNLPSGLKKRFPDRPQGIGRVCKDTYSFKSNDLDETIYDNTRDSKYLIVVCSPDSMKSEWVQRELRYFFLSHAPEGTFQKETAIRLAHDLSTPLRLEDIENYQDTKDYVILVSADSMAKVADPSSTFFPELASLNIISIPRYDEQTRKISSDSISYFKGKLIGSLLGIDSDVMIEFEKKKGKKKWEKRALLLIAVICLGIALKAFFFGIELDFRSVGFSNFTPRGLDLLMFGQESSLAEHYRITYKHMRPVRMERVNSHGSVIEGFSNAIYGFDIPPIVEFSYGEDAEVPSEIRKMSADGTLTEVMSISKIVEDLAGAYYAVAFETIPSDMDYFTSLVDTAAGKPIIGRNRAVVYLFDNGLPSFSFNYFDDAEAMDYDGNYATKYEFDSEGRLHAKYSLTNDLKADEAMQYIGDATYSTVENADGSSSQVHAVTDRLVLDYDRALYGKEYTYSEDGLLVAVSNLGNEPGIVDGFVKLSVGYDESGNVTSLEYSNPSTSSIWEMWDKLEAEISVEYSFGDVDSMLVRSSDASMLLRLDFYQNGKFAGFQFLDGLMQPVAGPDGYSGYSVSYPDNEIRESFIDTSGKPVCCKDGYATKMTRYDDEGHIVSILLLDELDSRAVSDNLVWNYKEYAYQMGIVQSISYYKGSDFLFSENYLLDTRPGRGSIEIRYFDEDDELASNRSGLQRKLIEYDSTSNSISILEEYSNGYTKTFEYESSRDGINYSYFDTYGDYRFAFEAYYNEIENSVHSAIYMYDGADGISIPMVVDDELPGYSIPDSFFPFSGEPRVPYFWSDLSGDEYIVTGLAIYDSGSTVVDVNTSFIEAASNAAEYNLTHIETLIKTATVPPETQRNASMIDEYGIEHLSGSDFTIAGMNVYAVRPSDYDRYVIAGFEIDPEGDVPQSTYDQMWDEILQKYADPETSQMLMNKYVIGGRNEAVEEANKMFNDAIEKYFGQSN